MVVQITSQRETYTQEATSQVTAKRVFIIYSMMHVKSQTKDSDAIMKQKNPYFKV
jgi:hypothetical protein